MSYVIIAPSNFLFFRFYSLKHSLWKKYTHRHWRRTCRVQIKDASHASPAWTQVLLVNVQSQENDIDGMGVRLAKQRKIRDCFVQNSRHHNSPDWADALNGWNHVLSQQSAGPKQDEGRRTMCLHYWCLVIKHRQSWRTMFPRSWTLHVKMSTKFPGCICRRTNAFPWFLENIEVLTLLGWSFYILKPQESVSWGESIEQHRKKTPEWHMLVECGLSRKWSSIIRPIPSRQIIAIRGLMTAFPMRLFVVKNMQLCFTHLG